MDLLLDSFDRALGFWLLHPLEKPKHEEVSFLVFNYNFVKLIYQIQ